MNFSRPRHDDKDEARVSRVIVAGRSLATTLAVFWKTSRLYDSRNIAYTQALANLVDSLAAMSVLENEFRLVVIGESLYVNDLRLKVDVIGQASYQFIVDEFLRRGIAGIRFLPGAGKEDVVDFSHAFANWQPTGSEPPVIEDLEAELQRLGVEKMWPVRPLAIEIQDEKDDGQPQRIQARRTFVRAMSATKMVMLSAKRGRRVDLRHAKRAVQSIVDLILSEELSLLGMTTLKDYDEYTYQHCVNVAILSISMGARLSLSKQQLSHLGVAGLLHDIGKVRIPNKILQKPGKLSAEEWAIMKTHPVEGVKIITKLHGVSTLSMRAMITAYEHHLNVDLSGYPRLLRRRTQNLFSRIVAISDCFDAMTAHRSYQSTPFTPYEALHYMTTQIAERFDTTLLKVFIRTVGIYPPGSVVQLNTGELALVIFPNDDDISMPTIQLLRDVNGHPCAPLRINLEAESGGSEARIIVDAVKPEDVGIKPEELVA